MGTHTALVVDNSKTPTAGDLLLADEFVNGICEDVLTVEKREDTWSRVWWYWKWRFESQLLLKGRYSGRAVKLLARTWI